MGQNVLLTGKLSTDRQVVQECLVSSSGALQVFSTNGGTSSGSVQGAAAHDAVIVGNPVRLGGRAVTANYTAVATGDTADLITTTQGVQIVRPYSIPDADWQYAAASGGIVDNVAVAVKAAGGAAVRNYVTGLTVQNVHATVATEFLVLDGATPLARVYLPALMTNAMTINFPTPLRGTAVTAVNIQCVTTGAQVYANLQGYAA
jgi:hypothetical protein